MCEFVDALINEGMAIGKKEGLAIGEKNMSNIILYLMKDNRLDDLQRIAKDAKHLEAIREEMKHTEC